MARGQGFPFQIFYHRSYTWRIFIIPFTKNEQLLFEYFPGHLHHIDSLGLRLLMYTPIWVEQESYTGDIKLVSSLQNQKFLLLRLKVLVALEDNSWRWWFHLRLASRVTPLQGFFSTYAKVVLQKVYSRKGGFLCLDIHNEMFLRVEFLLPGVLP